MTALLALFLVPLSGFAASTELSPAHGLKESEYSTSRRVIDDGAKPPAPTEMIEKVGRLTKASSKSAVSTRKIDPALVASTLPKITPDGSLADYTTAVQRQLAQCATLSAKGAWYLDGRTATRKEWCTNTANKILNIVSRSKDWAGFYALALKELDWYESVGSDGAGTVLYTGYYLPTLNGRRVKDSVFKFPLYRRPDDLVQVDVAGVKSWRRQLPDGTTVPYFTRTEIDGDGISTKPGALEGKGFEILYTDDLFENFSLQIQGSGLVNVVELNGTKHTVSINYSAQNGRKYVGIGSVLKSKGVDPSYLTLQGTRRYFKDFPDQLYPVLNMNDSYVFFSEAPQGPFGSAGTILVPWHSIAVDPTEFPMGSFALVDSQRPMSVVGDKGVNWQPYARMTVAQDTGGAIQGAGHVDVYWGSDAYAEVVAGQSAFKGKLYFAVAPKTP